VRKQITERYYRVMTYQGVDRVPDIEFGYWPQTLRRWLKEGMPVGLTDEEKNSMFLAKVDDFLGIESHGHGVPLKIHMNPCFAEEVLELRGDVTVMRDTSGTVAERYGTTSRRARSPTSSGSRWRRPMTGRTCGAATGWTTRPLWRWKMT
jgi:hypothetical protein